MGACEAPYANAIVHEGYDKRYSIKIIVNGLRYIKYTVLRFTTYIEALYEHNQLNLRRITQ
jgi:hypothetical protein